MFFGEDRHEKMVAVILADDPEERRERLDALLPLQQGDFEGLFEAMEGLPVTIRLLDPPLHEFLPDAHDDRAEVERARVEMSDDLEELERRCERVRALQEVNPMLGTRGVPARDPLPRDLRDAGRGDDARRARRCASAPATTPHLEVMVPLVDYERELRAHARADRARRRARRASSTRATTRSAR